MAILHLLLDLLAFLQPISFVLAIIWIFFDVFWLIRPDNKARGIFATPGRLTKVKQKGWRRIYACIYLPLAAFSAVRVISYQNTYIESVDLLHSQRGHPQAFYPRFFEKWGHLVPQMFQMMHLRAWAGEVSKDSRPEWAYFVWNAQQYAAGLVTFAFFLIVQCLQTARVRPLKFFTILTFIWISMTSLSCAHCLLFYFILVTPPLLHGKRYVSDWLHKMTAFLTIFQHLAAYSLMHTLNTASYQKYLLYMMAVPLTVPIIALLLPKQPSYRLRFVTLHEAQTYVFLTSGYVSAFLHLYSTYTIWWKAVETDINKPDYRLYLNQADAIQRGNEFGWLWYNLSAKDPSFGAITWDVLLTLASLLIWTLVNRSSYWGMVRSSFSWLVRSHQMPIWDGSQDIVDDGRTRAEMRALLRNDDLYPELPRSQMTDAGMIAEWDARAEIGRAVAMIRKPPMPYEPSRLPGWLQTVWSYVGEVVLAVILFGIGGLGWASAAVLGAGPKKWPVH
ncbi:hypothetical protein D6C76_04554 [Aureobasidium pullulans]|nr:hypothetical protein D6C76_04554 [Aureobasidium pullulans]